MVCTSQLRNSKSNWQQWEEKVPAWRSASWQPTVPLVSDAELARKLSVEHNEEKLMEEESNTDEEQK